MAIDTASKNVRASLGRRFSNMLEPVAGHVIGTLMVEETDGGYRLRDETALDVTDEHLINIVERCSYEISLRFVRHHPKYLWLHAGGVTRSGRAVLFPGGSGSGKSTLSVAMTRSGWSFLADDLIPLDPHTCFVLPFPRTPTIRDGVAEDLPRHRLPDLPKNETPLPPNAIAKEPVPLGTVVFPAFEHGQTASISPCAISEAVLNLLRHCVNFDAHEGAAVRAVCDLVAQCEAFRIQFGEVDQAVDMIAAAHAGKSSPRTDPAVPIAVS